NGEATMRSSRGGRMSQRGGKETSRCGRCSIYSLSLAIALLLIPPLWAQESLTQPEGPLDTLFLLRNTRTARISSYDPTGGNHDWVDIAPGETKVLAEIPGAGVIRRFYLAPLAADRMRYRKIVLRMYWDGEKDPSVEAPLGDFFGSGLGT